MFDSTLRIDMLDSRGNLNYSSRDCFLWLVLVMFFNSFHVVLSAVLYTYLVKASITMLMEGSYKDRNTNMCEYVCGSVWCVSVCVVCEWECVVCEHVCGV